MPHEPPNHWQTYPPPQGSSYLISLYLQTDAKEAQVKQMFLSEVLETGLL
jgi:hypothetical protein